MTNKESIIEMRYEGLCAAIEAMEWINDLLLDCDPGKRPTTGNAMKLKEQLRALERALLDML